MSDYKGKHVVVVGGATGMGAAAARMAARAGARVTVLDVAEVGYPADRVIQVDLREEAEVEAAIAALSAPVDVLFSCAGVADGPPGVTLVNFLAHRRLMEALLASGALGRGSAVVAISSTAGLGWEQDLSRIEELMAIPDRAGQLAWVEANRSADYLRNADGYIFSKRMMCAFVAMNAVRFLKAGVRLNAVMPGPTDTPLGRANPPWLAYGADYRAGLGLPLLVPDDIAGVLMFLGSDAARGIAGQNIAVDYGMGLLD
jgi:NAD(P)-dependent dehydrogenase (short-subunit alcohol dehydrogenase family)